MTVTQSSYFSHSEIAVISELLEGGMAETNLMQGTWTKGAIVRRGLKAGRQRKADTNVGAESAVMDCRRAWLSIRGSMVEAGVYTAREDVKIGLAMFGSDETAFEVLSVPHDVQHYAGVVTAAEELTERGMEPLGIVFYMRDREEQAQGKPGVHAWLQPWLVNEAARAAGSEVLTAFLAHGGEAVERTVI